MMDFVWTFFVVSSGKPFGQRKAHLVAEHRHRAGAGAVVLALAVVAHMPHEIEVLAHRRRMRDGDGGGERGRIGAAGEVPATPKRGL